MKVIVNHVLHFHSGGRTYVAISGPSVQEIPDWVLNTPVYEVGLWAGFIRPVESEPSAEVPAAPQGSQTPARAVAGRRRK